MKKRVLIVDDDKWVLDAFETALQMEGYWVAKAANAQQALSRTHESSFDLVILDFLMPGMDGLELLARIRKQQPTIRSIVISGKIDLDVGEEAISKSLEEQVECDIYLHKPVSPAKLKHAVRSLTAEGSPSEWKSVAGQILQVQSVSIKKARVAASGLRKLGKKRRK